MKSEIRPKKLNNINIILWRYFTLSAIIIIILVSLVCYIVLSNAFINQAKSRVNSIGKDISIFVSLSSPTKEALTERMWQYQIAEGVDVFLITPEGEIKLPEDYIASESVNEAVKNLNLKAGEWEIGKETVYNVSSTLNYSSCVEYEGSPYFILVRYPLAIVMRSVRTMQLYVFIIAIIVIALVFVIAYSVSKKISGPITRTAAEANRLAKGDFGVRFTSMEYREIAQLSDALNFARDEIKKSDEFQKELIANVSHDLKTPLTMIKAYASMVKEISGDDPEKRDKHLQVIIDESDRLTGLVNDVLSASKISSGLEQLNKKVFNLTEFLYSVINRFDYLRETQGYVFMADIDPNLYTLADEEKIGQVFYNLLSNAVNYTGEDKTIYICLKDCPEDNRIKFSVRDTGKGIPADELENIWDRYYRSKQVHQRPVQGTGLGLNIVKVVLQSHNFDFGVTSSVGNGSTFYVDFPSVPATPEELD